MAISVINFLTQPLSTAYNLYHSDKRQKQIEDDCVLLSQLAGFLGKNLDADVKEKIENFISSELKMDPKKLVLQLVPDLQGPAGAKGSIQLSRARGILAFSPEFVEEVKKGLTASHKFAIAHELGHLEYDDNCKGQYEKEKASQWASLATYSVIALASPFIPVGIIGIHLLACTAAKCAELYTSRNIQMKFELRADLHAAKQSPEIASGGITCVRDLQRHNLSIKNPILSLFVNSSGDVRLFDPHPPGQTRIDQITPYFSPSSNS